MKKCNKCLLLLPLDRFGKESRAKNGYKPRCKKCINEYYNSLYKKSELIKRNKSNTAKKYYEENKEEIIKKRSLYYLGNKNKIIERHKKYLRIRKQNDPKIRTLSSFRTLVKRMIKNSASKTFDYLGYSFLDLIKTLGRIPNREENIDHKIPISWFIEGTEMKIIFHLENLQILSAMENRVKGNRYSHEISKLYYDLIIDKIKPNYKQKIKYGN